MLFYQSYGDNNRLKTFDNYKKLSIWSKIILTRIKNFIKKLLTIVQCHQLRQFDKIINSMIWDFCHLIELILILLHAKTLFNFINSLNKLINIGALKTPTISVFTFTHPFCNPHIFLFSLFSYRT